MKKLFVYGLIFSSSLSTARNASAAGFFGLFGHHEEGSLSVSNGGFQFTSTKAKQGYLSEGPYSAEVELKKKQTVLKVTTRQNGKQSFKLTFPSNTYLTQDGQYSVSAEQLAQPFEIHLSRNTHLTSLTELKKGTQSCYMGADTKYDRAALLYSDGVTWIPHDPKDIGFQEIVFHYAHESVQYQINFISGHNVQSTLNFAVETKRKKVIDSSEICHW